jgi:hypothetical protein
MTALADWRHRSVRPDWPNFHQLGACLLKADYRLSHKFSLLFCTKKLCINCDKNWVWLCFGRFFHKLDRSPCSRARVTKRAGVAHATFSSRKQRDQIFCEKRPTTYKNYPINSHNSNFVKSIT